MKGRMEERKDGRKGSGWEGGSYRRKGRRESGWEGRKEVG